MALLITCLGAGSPDTGSKSIGFLLDEEPGKFAIIPIVVGEDDNKLDQHGENRKKDDSSGKDGCKGRVDTAQRETSRSI